MANFSMTTTKNTQHGKVLKGILTCVVTSLLLHVCSIDAVNPLHVAAFNVRQFGRNVMDKPEVVPILVQIFNRYDIVALMETRDSTNTALDDLKKQLIETTGVAWDYIASDQLGRSKQYMEQYVYFYKTNSATFVKSYQVDDSADDVYIREPFCVEFEYAPATSGTPFNTVQKPSVVFMVIHTQPKTTRQELEKLPGTIKSVAAKFPDSTGVITMGDMNADCRYLAGKYRKTLEIFNHEDFKSLIPDQADTTTKKSTNCAYDRVVLYGDKLKVKGAKVFNFQTAYALDTKEASEVSDHFPVEFFLY